jgi:Cu/Ag efflux protein CusF
MYTGLPLRAGSIIAIEALCAILLACRSAPPAKRYTMHGDVVALNSTDHLATIKHGPIGDWMGAMTMEYPVRDNADWKQLAVGAHIDATVFVTEGAYYIGEVKIKH